LHCGKKRERFQASNPSFYTRNSYDFFTVGEYGENSFVSFMNLVILLTTLQLQLSSVALFSLKEVVDAWLNSRGHRYNLPYQGHTAGEIGCYEDKCVFLGVNHQRFGQGCHTAVEGKQFWQGKSQQPGKD